MKELLSSLDWNEVIVTIWTVVLLPILTYIGNEVKKYAEAKKIDKYTDILQKNVVSVVKDVYETIVKDIKGTDEWTDEKIEEIRQKAIDKAIASMSYEGYKILKEANSDFDSWVDSIIRAKLYDLKKESK